MNRKEAYTDKVLFEALTKLLAKKPPEKISVTELCQEADINRATFYARYYSMEEYYSKIAENYVRKITEKAAVSMDEHGINHEMIKNTVKESLLLYKDFPALYPLWRYINKVSIHKQVYAQMIPKEADSRPLRFVFDFLMSGAGGVCTQWKDDGCKIPVDTMAENLAVTIELIFRDVLPKLK